MAFLAALTSLTSALTAFPETSSVYSWPFEQRMTRSPWNFVAASRWIIRSGCDSDGGRVVGADGVTEGSCELRELAVALDATELRRGGQHPGGRPPQAHVAVLPPFYVAGMGAHDLDHRLHRVRRHHRL